MPRIGDDGQWITTRPPPPPPQQAPPPGPPGNAPPPPAGSATGTQVLGKIALEIGKRPLLSAPASGFGVEWFKRLESEQFLDEHAAPRPIAGRSLASHSVDGTVASSTKVKPQPASSLARLTIPVELWNASVRVSERPVVNRGQSSHPTSPGSLPAPQHLIAHRLAAFESARAHPTVALTEHMHQHGYTIATAAPAASRLATTTQTTASALRAGAKSASQAGKAEAKHYTNRKDVELRPGQTIGFAAGKGYYARGKPVAPPGRAPTRPALQPTSDAASGGGYGQRSGRGQRQGRHAVVVPSASQLEKQFRSDFPTAGGIPGRPGPQFQRSHYDAHVVDAQLKRTWVDLEKAVRDKKMSVRVAQERMKVVARALSAYGTDYAWDGGHDPKRVGPSLAAPETGRNAVPFNLYKGSIGFDCSGFVRYAFHGVDHSLGGAPLPTTGQIVQTVSITRSQLQPGDLIFYGTKNDHVAIYLGNGKNGKIIDAPQTFVSGGDSGPRDYVQIEHLDYPGRGGESPRPGTQKAFVYGYARSERFESRP